MERLHALTDIRDWALSVCSVQPKISSKAISACAARRKSSIIKSNTSSGFCLAPGHFFWRCWEDLLCALLPTCYTLRVHTITYEHISDSARRGISFPSSMYSSAKPRTCLVWTSLHFKMMTALNRPLPPTNHSRISLWRSPIPSLQPDSIITPGRREGAILSPTFGDFCMPTYGPSGNLYTACMLRSMSI